VTAQARLDESSSTPEGERWTENRSSGGWRGLNPRELWSYRELGLFLALRDLKVRYKQAAFGVGWVILQPLAGAAVFTVVFRRIADMPSDGIPYPVFAFAGLALWAYFSSGVTKSTEILVENSPLVTKVYFPRLIAPLASTLPGLVDFGIGLGVLGVLMAVYGVVPSLAVLTVPLWIVALVAVTAGMGLWLATLNVQYRDVRHGTGLLLQLGLFVSPVAYPASSIAEPWRPLYFANPMAGVVEGFRWAVLGGPWPGWYLAMSAVVAITIVVGGVAYFQRSERRFADVI
jgi:lipopolysaccharide transport system permease protein